jgi:hypothetical protein
MEGETVEDQLDSLETAIHHAVTELNSERTRNPLDAQRLEASYAITWQTGPPVRAVAAGIQPHFMR